MELIDFSLECKQLVERMACSFQTKFQTEFDRNQCNNGLLSTTNCKFPLHMIAETSQLNAYKRDFL